MIVKGGGALETLARARTLVFDKTGTLTSGSPTVAAINSFGSISESELLRLAGSLDQVSQHVFADGIVAAARERHLQMEFPEEVREYQGQGIEGTVSDHRVAIGQARWLMDGRPMPEAAARVRQRLAHDGTSAVFIAVDGAIAGALVMVDTAESLDAAIEDWNKAEGRTDRPLIVSTHARALVGVPSITFRALREKIEAGGANDRLFLIFGTGFVLTEEFMRGCDLLLEPVHGAPPDDYRHLSVRSAVSIILDRLRGAW